LGMKEKRNKNPSDKRTIAYCAKNVEGERTKQLRAETRNQILEIPGELRDYELRERKVKFTGGQKTWLQKT